MRESSIVALILALSMASLYALEIERNDELVNLDYTSRVCITLSRLEDQISQHREPVEQVESIQCYESRPWVNRGPNASEADLPIVRVQVCRTENPNSIWSSGRCSDFHRVESMVVE